MNLLPGDPRFLVGCSAGLDERTAVLEVEVSGDGAIDATVEARIREGLESLRPPDDLDWPDRVVDDDGSTLGHWLVTVIVALQQWGGDPVWRGRVLRAESGLLTIAVPWWRERLARAAHRLGVQVLGAWIKGMAVPPDSVWAVLEQARQRGLAPDTMRMFDAAWRRGMPFGVLPHCVQFGWGAEAVRFDLALTDGTSWMATALAGHQEKSRQMLANARIPSSVDGEADGDGHRVLIAGGRMLMAVKGGAVVDVTAAVHPDNAARAVRAARVIGLDIAEVELVTTDIGRSWLAVGGTVAAVRARPDLAPYRQDPDIGGRILDALTGGRSVRIPTAAITGTNGKSTTAEMLSRIWTAAGKITGVCTTTHLRIGEETVSTENLSGYPGARVILDDPAVQAAVLEMPRKGLIMYGHPCDRYDVAALLNVQDDHLGEFGIDTLEQMAELKAEVLQRATGAVVVNADDPLCMAMLARAGTDRRILVTADPASVADHRSGGGEAVFAAEHDGRPWIMLCTGDAQTPLMPVHEIPATMNGLLRFNESNAMFAAALAWAQGVERTAIRTALAGFHNSVEQNPGRYNFVDGLPFQLMLDYAHNPDGVREACAIADALPVEGRRILCSLVVGNLEPSHFVDLAPRLAESFDEFVVGCVPAAIERSGTYPGEDPVGTMIATSRDLLLNSGVPADRVSTEQDPVRAVRSALASARPGDLVVLLAKHQHALPVIDDLLGEGVAR